MSANLRALQERFWRCLRTGGRPGPADMLTVVAPQFVTSAGALDAAARVGIYRRMYWFRQVAALRDTFAPLAATLDDAEFTVLACAYLDQHPSTDPRLEYLGARLPAFLASSPTPAWAALAPRAGEVWAETAAALAPDAQAFNSLGALAADTFAEAILRWVPSLQLAALPSALVAFWRCDGEIVRLEVPADEHAGLLLARAGAPMAQVCEELQRSLHRCSNDEATTEVGRIIAAWFRRQWIAGVEDSACAP